ncbi:MAG: O-antigen ligase family protein [Chloroflexi bacterium]|nr:O-antigen ligase family protein [Chloroflexota bacterium]
MQPANVLQEWVSRLDRRTYAIIVGAVIGLTGGLIGLLLAVAGPVIAVGLVLGLLAGLYVLTSVSAALYGVILVTLVLPFGTLPVKIGLTPTFLDAALGAFLLVYLFQWMTGRRSHLRLTPIHALVALYAMWLIVSFLLGMRHAPPTATALRQFTETLLSIGLTFVLVDLLRDAATLRRLVLVVIIAVGMQALVAIGLYALPDNLAEWALVRLSRIGYPDGGVIRYVEDNPLLGERAIGTWVDPNALGGMLAISAAMIAPQVFARRPVLRYRWLTLSVLGLVTLALILTYSRASMLAFAAGLLFTGLFRPYRKYLLLMLVGAATLLLLPQTQAYIQRFAEALTASDLATQMRLGEYSDSLRLISRYPLTGVGFTGTPEIDIYTDVASMYLIMANQIGLTGVFIFAALIAGVGLYGRRAWDAARANPELASIHIGYHAALIAALLNATADLYFFRLDFQSSITLFWLVVALALASSRLALAESTVAKTPAFGYYSAR